MFSGRLPFPVQMLKQWLGAQFSIVTGPLSASSVASSAAVVDLQAPTLSRHIKRSGRTVAGTK
jgi:hypothetical protein